MRDEALAAERTLPGDTPGAVRARRFNAFVVVVLGVVALWYLFGWSTLDNPSLGIIRQHRYFGRTTILTADTNRDGSIDFRAAYQWSDPYQGTVNGPCGDNNVLLTEDRNHDGRWDTWVERVGICQLLWRADTTGDGAPDWQLQAPYNESQKVYEVLQEKRGF